MTFWSLPAQGYFLQTYGAPPAGLPTHFLGGSGAATEACVRCDQPLVTLLSLDTSDDRLDLGQFGNVHLDLHVCADCKSSDYTVTRSGEFVVLASEGDDLSALPFHLNVPGPAPIALHAIPDRIAEARVLDAENRLAEAGNWVIDYDWQKPVHQVGGMPALARAQLPTVLCPLCLMRLPFLAAIACDATTLAGETEQGAAQVLFFLCRDCLSISAFTWRPPPRDPRS